MTESANLVKVSILGKEYTVKAPADADYIKQIADYVDEKMKDVHESLGQDKSLSRVAILSAMNISDELFNARREKANITENIGGRISSIIELIDENLAK